MQFFDIIDNLIRCFLSQLLPSIWKTPYEAILVVLQTKNEIAKKHLFTDGSSHEKVSDQEFLKVFIARKGLLGLWTGVHWKFYADFVFLFSNSLALATLGLADVDASTPFWRRYGGFAFGMFLKTLLAWGLGYWSYIVWVRKVTEVHEGRDNKKKPTSSGRGTTALAPGAKKGLKGAVQEIAENKEFYILVFLMHHLYNQLYLACEFLCDTTLANMLKAVSPELRVTLLRSLILLFCETTSWPLKSAMLQIIVSYKRRNNSQSKVCPLQRAVRIIQRSSVSTLYGGYLLFFSLSILRALLALAITTLSLVNRSRDNM